MRAYTRQYGAVLGLLWIVSFAMFIGSRTSPALSFLFNATIVATPFTVLTLARMYRDRILGGVMSFRMALAFSMFIFFNAMLILAIVQWAYFQFLDNGRMIADMIQQISLPEMKPVLDAYGVAKDELVGQLQMFAELRPIDFVLSFMWVNAFAGMAMSFVIALITKRTVRK